MHHLFPPPFAVLTEPNGSKQRKKFSIVDSQESFAIVGKTSSEVEAKLNLLKLQNLNIQPLLLVEGEISDVKSMVVYFDGIRYPVVKTLSAVDILFKLFFVFNIEFPKQSETIYLFLQQFFYEITSLK